MTEDKRIREWSGLGNMYIRKWLQDNISGIVTGIVNGTTTISGAEAEIKASIEAGNVTAEEIKIVLEQIQTAIQEIIGGNVPKQVTSNVIVVTGSGNVPVNIGGSVMNTGNTNGTWDGVILKPGISISWGSDGNNVYDAVAFDATGTEFLIEYSTVVNGI